MPVISLFGLCGRKTKAGVVPEETSGALRMRCVSIGPKSLLYFVFQLLPPEYSPGFHRMILKVAGFCILLRWLVHRLIDGTFEVGNHRA